MQDGFESVQSLRPGKKYRTLTPLQRSGRFKRYGLAVLKWRLIAASRR